MKIIPIFVAFAVGASAATFYPLNDPERIPTGIVASDPGAGVLSPGLSWGAAQLFNAGGNELFYSGEYDRAIQKYSDALLVDDEMPETFFLRGQSHWRMHRLEEAIADFSRAIEHKHGGQAVYYLSRCTAYLMSENWNAAIADCSDAIELAPTNGGSYVLRGSAYFFKGEIESALADSLVALMIQPGDPNARRLLELTLLVRELRGR